MWFINSIEKFLSLHCKNLAKIIKIVKILIVTATNIEAQYFIRTKQTPVSQTPSLVQQPGNNQPDLLITGIGQAMMSYGLTKILMRHSYDFVINAGIAGAYNHLLSKNDIVMTTREEFADLGNYYPDTIHTIFDKHLHDPDAFPFRNGKLFCPEQNIPAHAGAIKKVKGITVNALNRTPTAIQLIRNKFKPDIETMEGAAFFYCCLNETIPFIEIRSISNYIEETNTKDWSIEESLRKLSNVIYHNFV